MEAKDKAKELYEKIYFLKVNNSGCWMFKEAAKQCALICVDEIIDTLNQSTLEFEYWEEVKQEINKL